MRRALLTTVLILIAVSARAEDFTGFYAGLNAGYGWSRDRSNPRFGNHAAPERHDAGPDLPPSALDAAASIRGGRRVEPDIVSGR